jgi:hypothetical protein
MTNKEKALLEVMNSKDLSDEAKLYIVQNLKDDTVTQEPIKQESTTGKAPTFEDYWPDVKPRLFNPDAGLGDFPTMTAAMEAVHKACEDAVSEISKNEK